MNYETSRDIFEQLPGYIGWKDKNLYHLGCNRNLAAVLRLEDTAQIIGLKDQDLIDHNDESDSFHKKNDLLVLHGNIVKGIHRSSTPYDGSLFLFVKKPIFDNSNQISGLIYYCHEFFASSTFSNIFEINIKNCSADFIPSHYRIASQDNVCNLSERELECLFFILRGKSAKQIGEYIRLSKRTVESYIENVKNKFGCHSKSELIIKALRMEYMSIIPPRFLQNDFVNILIK
jgi:DNA-binding CsgD family transcriptional regulator